MATCFRTKRRLLLCHGNLSASSLPPFLLQARTAATQTTTTTATTTPPSVANLTHTSIKLLPPASPRGLLASCPRGGRGSNNGRLNGVGCRTRGGVRGRASLARLACSVVLLPPAVSVGAGPAVAAVVGGAGASGAGLGGGAAVASGPCSLVATLLANQWCVLKQFVSVLGRINHDESAPDPAPPSSFHRSHRMFLKPPKATNLEISYTKLQTRIAEPPPPPPPRNKNAIIGNCALTPCLPLLPTL